MPGISRRDSIYRVSTPPSPRSSGHVAFADTLVTGVSRKLDHDEDMDCYRFEVHAARCASHCRDPYSVIKAGRELCPVGRALAIEVAKLMFRIRGKDDVYYTSRTTGQETRIELSPSYNNVVSLLWALRSYGHGIMRPQSPVYEYSYPSTPKHSSRRTSSLHTESPMQIAYDTFTVEPKSRHHKSRRHSKSHSHDEVGHSTRPKRYSYEVVEPWQFSYPR